MNYKIPLFDLNYGSDEIQALTDTINDNWISTGPRCEKFEADFASALASPFALTVDNCTNALFMALMALDIGPGDEVLVPSLTFVATVNSVKYVGATPVFCDITSSENLCISAKEIEAKITLRTKAITVMHYAGFPCEMDTIMGIAKKHNLKVIEDACHGPLSEYQSRDASSPLKKLGAIGDIGCFSFFSNKNISTGEGGMLTCKDESIYKRLKLLRSHGMTTTSYNRAGGHSTKYDVVALGYNFRMDDLRAALGIVQLAKLKDDLIKRAQVRQWYDELLVDTPGVIVPFSGFNNGSASAFYSNYIFPIMLKQGDSDYRDAVRDRLHAAGVQTSVHYPAAHRFSIYQSCHASLPVTEFASDHLITLPMYSKLSKDDVGFIVAGLRSAIKS